MELAGNRIFFQRQIGVEHGALHFAGEGGAEERSQSEVRAAHAPLVVKGSFVGRYDVAAVVDKLANLLTLQIRKRCDIGKDQGAKRSICSRIEQSIMHHLEGNPRFDQRLVKAERRVVD